MNEIIYPYEVIEALREKTETKVFKGFAQNLENDYEHTISKYISGMISNGYKLLNKETTVYNVQNCAYYAVSIIFHRESRIPF